MRLWTAQSSRPSICAQYIGSPTSCRSPLSRKRRRIHIYTIKVLPARVVDRAARAVPRALRAVPHAARAAYHVRRADAQTAARLQRATQTAYTISESVTAGGQVIWPQRPSICAFNALSTVCPPCSQRLPPGIRTSTGKQGQPDLLV